MRRTSSASTSGSLNGELRHGDARGEEHLRQYRAIRLSPTGAATRRAPSGSTRTVRPGSSSASTATARSGASTRSVR